MNDAQTMCFHSENRIPVTAYDFVPCGREQNTLWWKHQLLCLRAEEHRAWLCATGQEACPTMFVLYMKGLHSLVSELVAAARWPLLWEVFHLFLLFSSASPFKNCPKSPSMKSPQAHPAAQQFLMLWSPLYIHLSLF